MWNKPFKPFYIKVGARASPLSRVQVDEVLGILQKQHPYLCFDPVFVTTYGDRDHTVSLRSLDKTDFFTREIDVLVQKGQVRLGIHSAKDLPDPLPEDLCCVALTQGIDGRDALVFREPLQPGALVATSSERREQSVRSLYPQVRFIDVRGTIMERLALLEQGKVEGVVIAEAALIRLRLTHLSRVFLPGETSPLQGKLALIAHKDDEEMARLCQCI